MSIRLTILCENTVGRPIGAIGEHGFACLVETQTGNLLFDTGSGAGIIHNSRVLGRDLTNLRGIILSHGHYDHTGGMTGVLAQTGPIDVYAHPEVFTERFWVGEHERRSIGLPFKRKQLESLGARFHLRRDFCELIPGVHFTGEIPRRTPFETGDPHLMVAAGDALVADPLADDASLVIETEKGLVVLLGCAHAGVVNIMRHVAERTGRDRIHAIIGGTHLSPAADAQFAGAVHALREFKVEKIGVAHCTGLPRAAQLHSEFGGRIFFASVGSVLEFS
jgi:7,8-dihydropterin-6-yl-methyl-4-(beta-D-ribofuranosyl)aminobenzene 5'-phosphate synthase